MHCRKFGFSLALLALASASAFAADPQNLYDAFSAARELSLTRPAPAGVPETAAAPFARGPGLQAADAGFSVPEGGVQVPSAADAHAPRPGGRAEETARLIRALIVPVESPSCFRHNLRILSMPQEEVPWFIEKKANAFWAGSVFRRSEAEVVNIARTDSALSYRRGFNVFANDAFLARYNTGAGKDPAQVSALSKAVRSAWTSYNVGYEDNNAEVIGEELFVFSFHEIASNGPSDVLVVKIMYCHD